MRKRTDAPVSLAIASILLFGSAAGAVGVLAAVPTVALAATPALTIVLAAAQEFWLEPHTTGGVGALPDPAVSEAEEPRREAA